MSSFPIFGTCCFQIFLDQRAAVYPDSCDALSLDYHGHCPFVLITAMPCVFPACVNAVHSKTGNFGQNLFLRRYSTSLMDLRVLIQLGIAARSKFGRELLWNKKTMPHSFDSQLAGLKLRAFARVTFSLLKRTNFALNVRNTRIVANKSLCWKQED